MGPGLAYLAFAAALAAVPATAQERTVWHDVEVTESSGANVPEPGPPPQENSWRSRVEVRFRYVEIALPDGSRRFLERHLDWTLSHSSTVHKVRGGRQLMDSDNCEGSGSLDLGPATSPDFVTREQQERMRPRCESWSEPYAWGYWRVRRPSVRAPPLVHADCHSEEAPGRNYQVWRARTEAAVDVAPAYARFVPEPGRRLSFTARARVPVRFRFALEDVSSFPGFATNASVDPSFFRRFGLGHLAGRYRDGDPDLVFDPDAHPSDLWNHLGWSGLTTKRDATEVTAEVTALDYGAWGRLRVFARSGCGGWEPVPFRQAGTEVEALTLPLDDDHNLMADALLPVYAGDPKQDLDGTPEGEGTPGDGLTLFEEYRGFVTLGVDCNPGASDRYLRTAPTRKDLFVHSPDPVLARLALRIADATDLAVHCIRARQFVSPEQRVVNFTLQQSGRRRFRGETLSQAEPQHGLYLLNQDLGWGGLKGMVVPGLGPPGRVEQVLVHKAALASDARELAHTVLHELGHAVGIRHHGDGNVEGPVVLLDHAECTGAIELGGLASGRPGCRTSFVAVQGGQNSGQQSCPMKYVDWRWYTRPGTPPVPFGYTEFVWHAQGEEFRERIQALLGEFGRYEKEADAPGTGRFCAERTGSGINAASRGARNHAGNAMRSCAQQIRVNDVDSWGDDEPSDGE
jgi:hypothetical protein